MAHDLIPPPSPAGRPDPDAHSPGREPAPPSGSPSRGGDSLWSGEDEARRTRNAAALAVADPAAASGPALDEAAGVARARHTPSPYRSRFGFVLGALVGVALAAVGAGVLITTWTSGSSVPAGWSAWAPTADDRIAAVRQIAEHVGQRYRLGDGNQLVAVQSGPLEFEDVPLNVAVRSSAQGGNIELIDGRGVLFTLNGLGPRGSIPSGTPSRERHLLLRREGLELALYTFRYREDVDMVVALLPPPPPASDTTPMDNRVQALFYRPGDLKAELDVPLSKTLSPKTPRPETLSLDSAESQKVAALTRSNLFLASVQQGQDAQGFLVLDRLPK